MTASVFFITLLVLATVLVSVHCFYLPKREMRVGATDPKKRPFCNAFTGCGRKRSNIPAHQPSAIESEPLEESIGSLLELSAEPAVEDISRQIMSEAKLWEAIQEANVELSRVRQQSSPLLQHKHEEQARTDNAGGAGGAMPPAPHCALPPCFIK